MCVSVQPSEGNMVSTCWLFNLCLPTGKSSRAGGVLPVNYTLLFLLPPCHPVNSNPTPVGQPASTHKSIHSRSANVLLPTSLYAKAPRSKAALLQLPQDTGGIHPLLQGGYILWTQDQRTMNHGHCWPLKCVDDRLGTKYHVEPVISEKRPTV